MGFSKKTYTKEELLPFFDRTRSRGPDMSQILETPSGWLCFHRLAIMGLTEAGMQPFELDGDYVVCNGEIYGFDALRKKLEGVLDVPFDRICAHEFVASAPEGLRALDIAKALLDRGFHAPTVYFPLIVHECLMAEPTETESKQTLDAYIEALREIVALGKSDPQQLLDAPVKMPVRRLDETAAARHMILTEDME